MRRELTRAVNESTLSVAESSVLRHVAECGTWPGTGEVGVACPTVADIVICTGASRVMVLRCLATLRRLGWLEQVGLHGQVPIHQCREPSAAGCDL